MERRFIYHVFLSHNSAQKDWTRQLVKHLREAGLSVFFDEDSIRLGEDILTALENGLTKSRHVLLVLSPQALKSRWVALELSTSLYRDPDAAARFIIPIVREECELPLTLGRLKYLDARGDDTDSQIEHLLKAIDRGGVQTGAAAATIGTVVPLLASEEPAVGTTTAERTENPSAQSQDASLTTHYISEAPACSRLTAGRVSFDLGGTISPHSSSYVERQSDRELRRTIAEEPHGGLAVIWGPRQIGKSSLVGRALEHERRQERRTSFVDFSAFSGDDTSQVLYSITCHIADDLGVAPPAAERFLSSSLESSSKFISFLVRRCGRAIIAFDEVDYLKAIGAFDLFFRTLRAAYSEMMIGGQDSPFILVSSFLSPRVFLDDPLISPFNIGYHIRLKNFSAEEITRMFANAGIVISEQDVATISYMTGGQPYLVQSTAFQISSGLSIRKVFSPATFAETFGMHLETMWSYIEHTPAANQGIRKLLKNRSLEEDELWELKDRGVIVFDRQQPTFACHIYRCFFAERIGASLRGRF